MGEIGKRDILKLSARFSVGLALAAGLLAGAPALAHSFLVDATPSSKDHVATPPKTIKLRFGGGVEPAYSKLTIETPDGKALSASRIRRAN